MNDKTIQEIGFFLERCQLPRIRKAFSPESFVRLTYTHDVKKEDEQNFDGVAQFLANKFRVLKPEELFLFLENKFDLKGQGIVMSFDDGLMSSYRAATTILSKYDIKAIFFIPTKILSLKTEREKRDFASRNLFYSAIPPEEIDPDVYETMGEKEILELQGQGHAIYPHTHSHCLLNEIQDEQRALEELLQPKEILEDLLHEPVNAFAIPVGTERVVSNFSYPYIKKYYRYCFSVLSGINTQKTNPYLIHRDCIHAHHPLRHVQNVMRGVFDPYYFMKNMALKRKLTAASN